MAIDSKVLYGIGAACFASALVFMPDYQSIYITLAFVISGAAFTSPFILDYLSKDNSPFKLRRKTLRNITGLVFFIWLIGMIVLPILAWEEYKQNQIPNVHFQKINVYIVETKFGEYSIGVIAKVLNQWHKSLIVQELNFNGRTGFLIEKSKVDRSRIDSSGLIYFEIMTHDRVHKLDEKIPINLGLVEGENNFHLQVDTVKDIEFLSPPVFHDGFIKPNALTIKHRAVQPIIEGTWTFVYKSEKPNEQEQAEVTANLISIDKWNELIQ